MTDARDTDMVIDLRVDTDVSPQTHEGLVRIVERVCAELGRREDLAPSELSLSVIDDDAIAVLNQQYRNKQGPTDVLSFSLLEGDEEEIDDMDEERQVLGDVVISWPRTCAQAESYGHSVEREFAFLTAHGFLHLIGYDHGTVEEEAIMTRLQEEVLSALGYTR